MNNILELDNYIDLDSCVYISKSGMVLEKNVLVKNLLDENSIEVNDLLEKVKEEYNSKNDFYEDIKCLEDIKLIKGKTNMNDGKVDKLDISVITLLVCQECNLRCKYCYGDGGSYSSSGFMNFETAKKSIDFLFENTSKDEVFIVFFGGEPLMNFSLIEECVKYSKNIASKFKKDVSYSITCNGTLLNEKITKFLKENDFIITLSVDGDKEIHDSNRYYCDGRGCFEEVERKTNALLDYKNLTARATVSDTCLNYDEIYKKIRKIGIKSVFMAPCSNLVKEKEFNDLLESYDKFFETFDKCIKEENFMEARSMKNIYNLLLRIENPQPYYYHCGAAITGIAVGVNGDIYPCHRFVGQDDFCIGNNKELFDYKKYNNVLDELLVLNREKCKECEIVSLCAGDCPSENLNLNTSSKKTTNYICNYNKNVFKKALETYIKLSDYEKVKLGIKRRND
ncbi:MAG: PapB family radical SAM/SPASM ranthipeptide maturase [Clostridium sp.]|uniref:PapB family radical SAM/SPASM ranthipeptide maturase n=1 Tax=Clostridium sp. TaxID=1506 RepID=UPI003F36A636